MKILFFASDRKGSIEALSHVVRLEEGGVTCICDQISNVPDLSAYCEEHLVKLIPMSEVIPEKYDIGISYLFPKLIKKELIESCEKGIINFHPAPLPEYRGVSGACYAICKGIKEWGVTCHFIDSSFDTGRIICVDRFCFQDGITGIEATRVTQKYMFRMFEKVMDMLYHGEEMCSKSQEYVGEYHSKKSIEELKRINGNETSEELRNKVRGMFYPPYRGATIRIGDNEYTLIDDYILGMMENMFSDM